MFCNGISRLWQWLQPRIQVVKAEMVIQDAERQTSSTKTSSLGLFVFGAADGSNMWNPIHYSFVAWGYFLYLVLKIIRSGRRRLGGSSWFTYKHTAFQEDFLVRKKVTGAVGFYVKPWFVTRESIFKVLAKRDDHSPKVCVAYCSIFQASETLISWTYVEHTLWFSLVQVLLFHREGIPPNRCNIGSLQWNEKSGNTKRIKNSHSSIHVTNWWQQER